MKLIVGDVLHTEDERDLTVYYNQFRNRLEVVTKEESIEKGYERILRLEYYPKKNIGVTHYKGGRYIVLYMDVYDKENNTNLVVYKSEKTGRLYARPSNMFNGKVWYEGKDIDRFRTWGNEEREKGDYQIKL